ncbi:MAG: hypothetical protein ACQERD_02140 [Campylobacterota bacterium]
MKNLILIFIVAIFFTACGIKEQTVEINLPKDEKEELFKKEKKDVIPIKEEKQKEKKLKEKIFSLDSFEIIEDDNTLYTQKPKLKIAFAYPSDIIASYGKTSINTIISYFTFVKANYDLKVYDSKIEDKQSLEDTFKRIKEDGYEKVIALYTPETIKTLNSLNTDNLEVYLPLANHEEYEQLKDNFIYGSISYKKQIKKLLEYSSINNAMFYQESYIGNKLKEIYEAAMPNTVVTKKIKNDRNQFEWIVKDERLDNSTLMLNTSLVKTALILSQLRVYETVPSTILSTQLSFNPKLISLTQAQDRKNIIFANSIDKVDDKLGDILDTFGIDINYNWVAYSVLVGVDYLNEQTHNSILKTAVKNNMVKYEPKLYKTTPFGFSIIK